MYSKSNYQNHENIIIPENYRGNAFSGGLISQEVLATETALEGNDGNQEQIKTDIQVSDNIPTENESNQLISTLMPPKVSNPGGILNGIGLEELLIVGVLILLSQSKSDDDILLLLFLLLFYK